MAFFQDKNGAVTSFLRWKNVAVTQAKYCLVNLVPRASCLFGIRIERRNSGDEVGKSTILQMRIQSIASSLASHFDLSEGL